jgi:glucokinase
MCHVFLWLYCLRWENTENWGVSVCTQANTPIFAPPTSLSGGKHVKANKDRDEPLALGIEIGGTKVQAGIGSGNGKRLPKGLIRRDVVREYGAEGILRQIIVMVDELLESKRFGLSDISRIGIGFGGIVDTNTGVIVKSYQIDGWNNFPLKEWAEERWNKPVFIQNDASAAGLAEALCGAGRGCSRVFYITVGSGIGGGWIRNGKVDDGQGFGAAEIGHTWVPDPVSGTPVELEQVCSGWSIGRRARSVSEYHPTLMTELAGTLEKIDAKIVYLAAEQGDSAANLVLIQTCQTLGLAISNVIALLNPERIILGGGVSLMGNLFWDQLRKEIKSRAIPYFASQVELVPAELGESVVVIGALCLH